VPLALDCDGPTPQEVERLRLMLSTFQDGSGMLVYEDLNLPGWRDFERCVAQVFDGMAVESKAIFDILFPFDEPHEYGVSCKMRETLAETRRTGRITMELSNSSSKLQAALALGGLGNEAEFRRNPAEAARILLQTVREWHLAVPEEIQLERSSYLSLSWSRRGEYQLHQFAIELPDAATIRWSFPEVARRDGVARPGRRLQGDASGGKVFEYYYGSGGQLKYYPSIADAVWESDVFRLESLQGVSPLYDAETKAAAYFPEKWRLATRVNLI